MKKKVSFNPCIKNLQSKRESAMMKLEQEDLEEEWSNAMYEIIINK